MTEQSFSSQALAYKPKAMDPNLPMVQVSAINEFIPLQIDWSERKCTLLKSQADIMDEVLNFEVRSDDVFVTTYLKCGTTWMQETAWLLLNKLDFHTAKRLNITERSPNLDGSGSMKREPSTMEECRRLASPRLIKTHLPPNLLPKQVWQKKIKIIFVARNFKDTIVSGYHFIRNLGADKLSLDDFVLDFINNGLLYTPYLERVIDYWQMRYEPHIFFVTYEEMKRNLPGVLQRLCIFLGRAELTAEELEKTVEHLTFDKMKDNNNSHLHEYCLNFKPANPSKEFRFMRRGIVGSYKDEMSLENQLLVDNWSRELLEKHGITEQDIFGSI